MSRKCPCFQHSITVEELLQLACQLSPLELGELIAALSALKEAIIQDQEILATTMNTTRDRNQNGKSAHIAWKQINGCGPYPYLRFREGKRYRSYYLKGLKKEAKR
ncbi:MULTISPECIES: hypothetical protein [Leptolyngbya]|uniref:hypothetical protein n=1 Tax=Leptolyngbya TaxID=47251 RepID=UPI00168A3895|nr:MULTISPECIES: hypothetical protein [unclassified Leptolyngbya]MBD1855529.1 hypothetical protein [Leptolyngbya sp. FACHB-1624]MBN8563570.1 hypothetical protein [Leptolyngbya sp. UWPOB_LEPTO1]